MERDNLEMCKKYGMHIYNYIDLHRYLEELEEKYSISWRRV